MVVFTCNHCGDSLQKPKVEKHYLTVCRTAKFLTCVDCFKDFKNEEYVAHTKCITEEERYAAKGSLPQGVVKKGEVKQQSWTDLIHSIVENTANATGGQKKVFEIMSNASNVPRKKAKFINFIKSSSGNKINMRDVESVWDLIEDHKADQSPNTETKTEEIQKEAPQGNENGVDNPDEPKKKKKSKKHEENELNRSSEVIENSSKMDVETSETQELSKKKKKAKKNSKVIEENGLNDTTVEVIAETIKNSNKMDAETIETQPKLPKKKKKERKNSKVTEENGLNGAAVDVKAADVSQEQDLPKPKKKKSKLQENGIKVEENLNKTGEISKNIDENIVLNENVEVSKKKRKSDANVVNDEYPAKKKKGENNSISTEVHEENALDDSQISKFPFEEQILEIIKTKNNISLKKLEKKVLSAYRKLVGMEPTEKTIKKFNKKLKKVSGIEISDDKVKLIVS